uniref:C-type lectin domain-containing protein n=1 Tax=Pelusios castaneus TaxID=367368 RepID=A0A8C8SB67_9SAUR
MPPARLAGAAESLQRAGETDTSINDPQLSDRGRILQHYRLPPHRHAGHFRERLFVVNMNPALSVVIWDGGGVRLWLGFIYLLPWDLITDSQEGLACPSADLGPPAGPACPNGWVGFRGKCYYFSEDEGNWTSSQTHCSAFNTSLAGIDTRQDMDFMVRYKGTFDYWIGLRRDLGQPWKWANGTEFNNLFLIGGGGDDCAYLNQGEVSSSQCTDTRFWICSKPDVFTEARQIAVEEAGSLSGLEKL